MHVYAIQRYIDWQEGRPYWAVDEEEPVLYANEADAAKHVEQERARHVTYLRKKHDLRKNEVDAHNAKIDALEAAGLDPRQYMESWNKSRITPIAPFEPPELSDEVVGTRYVKVEVL